MSRDDRPSNGQPLPPGGARDGPPRPLTLADFVEHYLTHVVPRVRTRLVTRCGVNRDDADDILQEVAEALVTAWERNEVRCYHGVTRAEDLLEVTEQVIAWCWTVAWRESGRRRRRPAAGPLGEQDPAALEESDAVEGQETVHLVQRVLGAMSERDRELLCRRYGECERLASIAERLGISTKAVKSRLTRARQAFRDAARRLKVLEHFNGGQP